MTCFDLDSKDILILFATFQFLSFIYPKIIYVLVSLLNSQKGLFQQRFESFVYSVTAASFEMKGNLPEEEEASRQRVHKVLETFLAGKFKLVNCNPEIEYHTTSKITTHLFTALKNCLRHCNCEVSHQILQFLVKNKLCSKQFSWKMFLNFLEKDPNLSDLLSEATKVFGKFKMMHQDEIHLVNTIHLLKKGMFKEAQLEAIKFNGKMSSNDNVSAKTASLGLLEAYAMIFECQLIQPKEELLPDLKEVFHHLVSKHVFLPLLVEPYIFVLVQLNLQEEAEILLQKYVDMESKGNIGITSALHALNIMKIHLPKASLKLTISLLEIIADRFSGDPKVLELCHHHMHIHSSLDKECSSDLGSDGRAAYSHKYRHLNKCLRLIIYFLDVHIFNVPSPDIKEAWKIMADTIRGICLQGAEKCLQSIVELWYNDRQRWWPCFRFPRSGLPPTLAPDEAEFFSNKGFVCYILESDNHPFVAGLMDHGELPLLKSLITEMSHAKRKFDADIERLLRANKPIDRVPLISPAEVPQSNLTGYQATGFSSKSQSIDSEKNAKDFARYLKITKPIKQKDEYKSAAKIHKSTAELLKLPIEELVVKRYERRRTLRLQSRNRKTNSSSNVAPTAGCSHSAVDSSSFQLDESKCNTDSAKVSSGSFKQGDQDGHDKTRTSSVCKNTGNKAVNAKQIFKNHKVHLSKPSIPEPSTSGHHVGCNSEIQSEDLASSTSNTLVKARTRKVKPSLAKIVKAEPRDGDEEIKTKNPGAINKILPAKNNPPARKPLVNVVEESAKESSQISSTSSSSTQRPAEKPGKQRSTVQQRKSTRQRPLKQEKIG